MRVGDRIGVYSVVEKVGDGGMGEVFRAEDATLGRSVALKVLRPEVVGNEQLVERFRSEARLLARLEHPNIATVYNLLDEGGQIALVMEYVGGGSLEGLLRQKGKLDIIEVVPLVLQALDGVGYAHASGVVHRDLKPSNAMLTTSGLVKLVDFGIARAIGSARMTRSGHLVGTLEYMAPEQVKGGEGDARSDIYSVGIMLFELLAGNPPFKGATDYDLIRAQVESPVPPLRNFGATADEALEGVLAKALAKDPNDRYQDAEAFSEALRFAVPEAASARTVVASAMARPTSARTVGGPTLIERVKAPFTGSGSEKGLRVLMVVLVALLLAEGAYLAFGGPASPGLEKEPDRSTEIVKDVEEERTKKKAARTIVGGGTSSEVQEPIPVPPKGNVIPDKTGKGTVTKKAEKPRSAGGTVTAKIDSVSAHGSMRRKGAFAKAAGYSVKATLSRAAKVDEVYEVYSGGSRILRQVVRSKQRKAGRFSAKARVGALKRLDPGSYEARVRLESGGRLLAQHKFRLRIR